MCITKCIFNYYGCLCFPRFELRLVKLFDFFWPVPLQLLPLEYGQCNTNHCTTNHWNLLECASDNLDLLLISTNMDGCNSFRKWRRQTSMYETLPVTDFCRDRVRQLRPITKLWPQQYGGGLSVDMRCNDQWNQHQTFVDPMHVEKAMVKAVHYTCVLSYPPTPQFEAH